MHPHRSVVAPFGSRKRRPGKNQPKFHLRRGDVLGLESILLETNSLIETSQPRRNRPQIDRDFWVGDWVGGNSPKQHVFLENQWD